MNRKTTVSRLLMLAAYLEALPPKKFKYSDWATVGDGVPQDADLNPKEGFCGTKACALGHAPALPFAKRMGIRIIAYGFRNAEFCDRVNIIEPVEVAKILFGLSEDHFEYLFFPRKSFSTDKNRPGVRASAKTVAKHIRNFCRLHA